MSHESDIRETHQIEPYNEDVEQGVLGCLLTKNAAFDDIAHIIKPEHFFIPVHGEIFDAISRTIIQGKNASPVTLKNQFSGHKDIAPSYLADLAGSIVSIVNVVEYAHTLKELHNRRTLISGLKDVIAQAYDAPILDRGCVLEAANTCVNSLVDDIPLTSTTASDAIAEALAFMHGIKSGKIKAMTTGLRALDQIINGLYGKHLYIIAGRPGMGKTALAMNMADHVALQDNGTTSVFFSLEMGAEQLAMRVLAKETGISVKEQRGIQDLDQGQWESLAKAQRKYQHVPLIIEDCAAATLSMILSKARKARRTYGRFVMFIDYLGLMTSESRGNVQMVHQIAEITKRLKGIAKELDIPVVLLSQLNRSVEAREDKRPLKSDLRDSGAIEQDADVIIMPYRHEYYLARQEPVRRESEGEGQYEARHLEWKGQLTNSRGKAELIIAKNRYGDEHPAHVTWDGVRQLFHDTECN